ncbi:MAG: hypothetical protein P8X63_10130 [Desulfuromonadaceae bacterium]
MSQVTAQLPDEVAAGLDRAARELHRSRNPDGSLLKNINSFPAAFAISAISAEHSPHRQRELFMPGLQGYKLQRNEPFNQPSQDQLPGRDLSAPKNRKTTQPFQVRWFSY